MQDTPFWALALIYWLHMLGTVIWIGSLAAISLLVLPVAAKVLEPAAYLALLDGIQRRLEPMATFCLALLLATGMFQLGASKNYSGLFSTDNTWSAAILIKHVLFVAMIGASVAMTWFIVPALRRAQIMFLRTGREDQGQVAALRRREIFLLRLNFILALLVLAATAFARAS
jgi:uncharacterized membrane protein